MGSSAWQKLVEQAMDYAYQAGRAEAALEWASDEMEKAQRESAELRQELHLMQKRMAELQEADLRGRLPEVQEESDGI